MFYATIHDYFLNIILCKYGISKYYGNLVKHLRDTGNVKERPIRWRFCLSSSEGLLKKCTPTPHGFDVTLIIYLDQIFLWGDVRKKLAKIHNELLELRTNIQSRNRDISISVTRANKMTRQANLVCRTYYIVGIPNIFFRRFLY